MKVLHICPDDKISSGVNTFCIQLVRGLCARGVDATILRTVATPALDAFLPHRNSLLVHIHGLWLGAHHRAAVWARRSGVPVVWSTHGMTAPWSMRHKRWKKQPAWWLYQKHDLQGAAAIHCTTDLEVEWNRALGFANCFVAPLGTDLPSCPNQKISDCKSNNSPSFVVLFVGRLYPVKGLMNLVRAAALIKQTSNAPIAFRLVGPDQAGHRAELEAECRRMGVTNVVFAGEKQGADLMTEYETCDILVLPSFTENFGGVVIDALAHGKPVIASRFTPWKILDEQKCGWWVDNSPESLAETIREAADLSHDKLGERGALGRRLVDQKYSWAAVTQKMFDAYENIFREKVK